MDPPSRDAVKQLLDKLDDPEERNATAASLSKVAAKAEGELSVPQTISLGDCSV